jgi:hypothetical protein
MTSAAPALELTGDQAAAVRATLSCSCGADQDPHLSDCVLSIPAHAVAAIAANSAAVLTALWPDSPVARALRAGEQVGVRKEQERMRRLARDGHLARRLERAGMNADLAGRAAAVVARVADDYYADKAV